MKESASHSGLGMTVIMTLEKACSCWAFLHIANPLIKKITKQVCICLPNQGFVRMELVDIAFAGGTFVDLSSTAVDELPPIKRSLTPPATRCEKEEEHTLMPPGNLSKPLRCDVRKLSACSTLFHIALASHYFLLSWVFSADNFSNRHQATTYVTVMISKKDCE